MSAPRTALLVLASVLVSTSPAFAEDFLSGGPGFNWSGLSAGVDVGYADADVGGVFDTFGAESPLGDLDVNGAAFGGHVGYDFQIGKWVLGVEADHMGLQGGSDSVLDDEDDIQKVRLKSLTSVRGKLGYAFGSMLAYGTVGWGQADYVFTVENGDDRAKFEQNGVVYGGGLAWAIAPQLSLRAEWLHYDVAKSYGDLDLSDSDGTDVEKFGDVDVVRAGLTWHLNGREAAAAPMK